MPGDLPQDMDRDAGIGHPGKPGVPKVVTAKMLVAERGNNLIPVRRIAQHRRADPVPLENRIRLVTCRSSVRQAARVYSLIKP